MTTYLCAVAAGGDAPSVTLTAEKGLLSVLVGLLGIGTDPSRMHAATALHNLVDAELSVLEECIDAIFAIREKIAEELTPPPVVSARVIVQVCDCMCLCMRLLSWMMLRFWSSACASLSMADQPLRTWLQRNQLLHARQSQT